MTKYSVGVIPCYAPGCYEGAVSVVTAVMESGHSFQLGMYCGKHSDEYIQRNEAKVAVQKGAE